jgi:hypothetical protein
LGRLRKMSSKRKTTDKTKTISDEPVEYFHQKKMEEIREEKNNKKNLLLDILRMENELDECNKISKEERTHEQYCKIMELNDKIMEDRKRLKKINDDEMVFDYFSKVGEFINDVYQPSKIKLVSWGDKKNKNSGRNIDKYKKYVSIMDDKNVGNMLFHDEKFKYCKDCDEIMELDEQMAGMICHNCGTFQKVLLEPHKPTYDENTYEPGYYAYRRKGHFTEKLTQAQAKESKDIPQEVYEAVNLEMVKEELVNMMDLTTDKVKKYLRRHGFEKYYEHIPYIIGRLGIQPLKLTQHMENQLTKYFSISENAFEVLKRESDKFNKLIKNDVIVKRINFLPYNCVINRLCEALGYYDIMQYFPLLKSPQNLAKFYEAWRIICEYLKDKYPIFEKVMYKTNVKTNSEDVMSRQFTNNKSIKTIKIKSKSAGDFCE